MRIPLALVLNLASLSAFTAAHAVAPRPYAPFPSISNVRNFLKEVEFKEPDLRTVTVEGTVKLHGTHADIVSRPREGLLWYQSRNKVITLDADNMNCCRFMTERQAAVDQLIENVRSALQEECDQILIAGEWCGTKLSKGVALSQLPVPKLFVVFGIQIDSEWKKLSDFNLDVGSDIYSIARAPTYTLSIDISNPRPAIDEMKALTDAVEKQCPFSLTFGVKGGGEGIVWKCKELPDSKYWFKTKGASHMVSETQKVRQSTPEEEALMQTVNGFVDSVLLEPRLQQGLDYLQEMNLALEMKNIAVFMKWLVDDIEKEEGDALQQLQPVSKVHKVIQQRAKDWFRTKCN